MVEEREDAWSRECRQNREVVNCVRLCLGIGPLYNRTEEPEHMWLSMLSALYQESRQGRTVRRK